MTSPETSAIPRNTSTCERAFWPVVASKTSSTACGAVVSSLRSTRTILASSAIRSALFCRRPAVSISSTSALASRAFCKALNAKPAASAPGASATTSAPARSPHTRNCSMAAARNVSPAAIMTLRPSPRMRAASLPIVVVLPVPFTPTTSTTNGLAAVRSRARSAGAKTPAISSASASRSSTGVSSRPMRVSPRRLVIRPATRTPRSAATS